MAGDMSLRRADTPATSACQGHSAGRLLVHITYADDPAWTAMHDRDQARRLINATDGQPLILYWRQHTFNAILATLLEIDAGFDMFSCVDAVLDVNVENAYQRAVTDWARASLSRVHVAIHAHNLTRPLDLSWAHRRHMAANLEQYDWFLLTEDDTWIPRASMREYVRLAPRLFAQSGHLLAFSRVVNDTVGRHFYNDIKGPTHPACVVTSPGLGDFVHCQVTYAGCWSYPRAIMRGFVASYAWRYERQQNRANVRENAAGGWLGAPIVTSASPGLLRVYHL
eukprot:4965165-Prymnesium_polylepis.1